MATEDRQQNASLNFLLWAVVGILFIAGVLAHHLYGTALSFVASLAVGVIYFILLAFIASFSLQGKRFWSFARDARAELRKVVWPSRHETIQTTLLVIAMVIVTALILWGVDAFLMWTISWITG